MCCFLATLSAFWPPPGILDLLVVPLRAAEDFGRFQWLALAFPGLALLPWTTLAYALLFPVVAFDWIWLGLALLADLGAFVAGAARRRDARWYTGSSFVLVGHLRRHFTQHHLHLFAKRRCSTFGTGS